MEFFGKIGKTKVTMSFFNGDPNYISKNKTDGSHQRDPHGSMDFKFYGDRNPSHRIVSEIPKTNLKGSSFGGLQTSKKALQACISSLCVQGTWSQS